MTIIKKIFCIRRKQSCEGYPNPPNVVYDEDALPSSGYMLFLLGTGPAHGRL